MENYKRIAKSIRMHHLMAAVVMGVLMGILIFGIILGTGSYNQWLMGLAATAGVLVLFCVIGFFLAEAACAKIHHRIRVCEGTVSMESETFVPCAKELSHGREWLVYHKENTYLFWTKKMIREIKIVSQKRNRCTLAVYSNLHPEGEAISCSYDEEALQELKAWITSSQM
jgi:hypothetical protein